MFPVKYLLGFNKQSYLVLIFLLGFFTNTAARQQDTGLYVIGSINLHGNEQTKQHIVLRELAFKQGDTLTRSELLQYRDMGMRQIFNLKLFTSVVIEIDKTPTANVYSVEIYLKERWYLFVIPILELGDRNFNTWWESKRLDRLNYGVRVTRFNMRGRNETMRINMQSGFTRKISLDYNFPYINKKLTLGAAVNFTYSDNKEVWYETSNNKLQRFRDPDNILFTRYKSALILNYRKKIYSQHFFINEYNNLQINDTIVSGELNPNYFSNASNSQQSLYTAYNYTYDIRDFRQYALNGFMLSAEVGRYTFINSGLPFYRALLQGESNTKIADRQYVSFNAVAKYSSTAQQPYNLYRALGYDFFVRGFEYNVIDGQHFVLGKIDYRYNILKQRQYSFNAKKFKKFNTIPIAAYAKIYYDAGYVDNDLATPDNSFTNTFLNGWGIGVDLVTYYDRVIKFEYSFNNKGERGLFLHFNSLF